MAVQTGWGGTRQQARSAHRSVLLQETMASSRSHVCVCVCVYLCVCVSVCICVCRYICSLTTPTFGIPVLNGGGEGVVDVGEVKVGVIAGL